MKRITVKDVMAAKPCWKYTEEIVEKLWKERETLTPQEIAKLDIPAKDRLWAIITCCLNDRQRRHFACDCAELSLSRIENPDSRSVEAVRVARLYADGKTTDEQLTKARNAAYNAAYTVYNATYTVYNAACDAAWSAACDAACDAAWSAAYYAAYYAAWKAAYSASYETLLENAIKYAMEEE